jgi:hypothetical protein
MKVKSIGEMFTSVSRSDGIMPPNAKLHEYFHIIEVGGWNT